MYETLLQHTATYYSTLQHTATHCNTLQHTLLMCYMLQVWLWMCYRVAKTHIFIRHFSQKSPIISGPFAKNSPADWPIHVLNVAGLTLDVLQGGECCRFDSRCATGWRTPTGCLILISHFLQKSPIISGSFAKNDQQLEVSYRSSPPCIGSQVYCNTLQRTATHYSTLQHTATHCDTLQHTLLMCYQQTKVFVPQLYRPLSAKQPYNSWLFCEKRPAI